MTTFRNVPLNLEMARSYADLSGIAQDLEFTIRICEIAEAVFARDSRERDDFILTEALAVAAVVRYARCFVSGVRDPLPLDVLSQLSDEDRQDHDRFFWLRQRHVAHSVNPFEENIPVASVSDRPEESEPAGISVHHARVIGVGPRDFVDLRNLAGRLLSIVRAMIKAEEIKVLEATKAIPCDELRNRPGVKAFDPSWDDVRQRRP